MFPCCSSGVIGAFVWRSLVSLSVLSSLPFSLSRLQTSFSDMPVPSTISSPLVRSYETHHLDKSFVGVLLLRFYLEGDELAREKDLSAGARTTAESTRRDQAMVETAATTVTGGHSQRARVQSQQEGQAVSREGAVEPEKARASVYEALESRRQIFPSFPVYNAGDHSIAHCPSSRPPSFTTTRFVSPRRTRRRTSPLHCALGVDVYLLCHKLKSVY
jgi:hypothetical protein